MAFKKFWVFIRRGGSPWPPSFGQAQRPAPTEEEFVVNLMKQTGVFIHPGYFYDYEDGIHGVISFLCEREKLKVGLERLIKFIEEK